MNKIISVLSISLAALGLLIMAPAQAAMTLDSAQSNISFVSIKKGTAAEVHHFSNISGSLSDAGMLDISIALDSAETGIDIRNTRLSEMLFETSKFATASLTAHVHDSIAEGEIKMISMEAQLSLHGATQTIQVDALATRVGGNLIVTSTKPVIIKAADFALVEGINALRDIAKLPSIAVAVPVSFTLVFH